MILILICLIDSEVQVWFLSHFFDWLQSEERKFLKRLGIESIGGGTVAAWGAAPPQ